MARKKKGYDEDSDDDSDIEEETEKTDNLEIPEEEIVSSEEEKEEKEEKEIKEDEISESESEKEGSEVSDEEKEEVKEESVVEVEQDTGIELEHETIYVLSSERRSRPYLTKYEYVRLLGDRVKQLFLGAKPMIKDTGGLTAREIAQMEIEHGVIPLKLVRNMPDGKKELWKVSELQKK